MLYTLENVRANIRNRDGKRVFYLGRGDNLTSDAKDFLTGERIEILSGEQARKSVYAIAGGGYVEEKPEHMTHLNDQLLVPKTHPRIVFRGAVDLLEAELLLCQMQIPNLAQELGEILSLTRNIIRWDVMEEKAQQLSLCGMNQQELRKRSHMPQDYYGQPHFMPSAQDGAAILYLNRARCVSRQAELAAVNAFADRDGNPTRTDILQCLNRISSMLYILMIRKKAERQ